MPFPLFPSSPFPYYVSEARRLANEDLHRRLERLERALGQGECADERAQERVEQLRAELQLLLEGPEPTPAQYRSLRERLNATAADLEIAHPAATWVISDALNMLSRVGV